MGLKLITEFADPQSMQIIKEQDDVTKEIRSIKIQGPFLQAEVKNKNGRRYSRDLLEREVRKFNTEKISRKRALGELDHPPTPMVGLDRVSHMIESLMMDGNDGIGIARLMDTPMGKIAKSLILEGASIGVSTRGVGSVGEGGKVNNDFKLITIDLVADPSAPGAFVEGILENKEYIIDGDRIVEISVETFENEVKKNKPGSKQILDALQTFLNDVKGRL